MAMKKKLGLLLLSDKDSPDIETATRLAKAAIDQEIDVEMFIMGGGIVHINDSRLKSLAFDGAKITFCAQNARERAISLRDGFRELLNEGSQYNLACIVEESDRFISFS